MNFPFNPFFSTDAQGLGKKEERGAWSTGPSPLRDYSNEDDIALLARSEESELDSLISEFSAPVGEKSTDMFSSEESEFSSFMCRKMSKEDDFFKESQNQLPIPEGYCPAQEQPYNQVEDLPSQNQLTDEDWYSSSQVETKNIPKNYLKAIFTFIVDNRATVVQMMESMYGEQGIDAVVGFVEWVKNERRTKVYTIQRLRELWLNEEWGKPMRVLSDLFLRRHFTRYVRDCKVENKAAHIKHRRTFMRALRCPRDFTSIK